MVDVPPTPSGDPPADDPPAGDDLPTSGDLPTSPDDARIEIRRSTRRKRTVSARREGEAVVVLMPAGLPRAEERRLVADMLARLRRSRGRAGSRASDADLMRRATDLSARWLGGRPRPASVRWVGAMSTRWASCSPDTREIRISEALREVPAYVLDYVLVHELAHLVVPGGHPPEFWATVRAYPRTERAMGYLEAYARVLRAGTGAGPSGGAGEGPETGRGDGEGPGDLVQDDDESSDA